MRHTTIACSVLLLIFAGCSDGGAAGRAAPCCPTASPGALIAGVQDVEGAFNTESYDEIAENPFLRVVDTPLSTLAVDVDTASYSNVRRMLNAGQRPPAGAIRLEELVNYFPYDYAAPSDNTPFAVHVDVAECPWTPAHQLVRIGMKGKTFEEGQRPACNLVFLLDVSGSMDQPNKLPLVKRSIRLLLERLGARDRIAIVVYAGAAGLVLPSTEATNEEAILRAIDDLEAGGSTNGAEGINLAYATAVKHFKPGGVNRVILATDGDFNVGITDQSRLVRLIQEKARQGVFLTVLGFGMGNYKDSTLEKLADKGNGAYGYIDDIAEARKILVEQAGGTLVTIAKDVKIQVEFNPAQASAYRLLGYENRLLAKEDFNDDQKDAGEIGAGHTVTAFYEVVPVGVPVSVPQVDPSRYQPVRTAEQGTTNDELLFVKVRYKDPQAETSRLLSCAVPAKAQPFDSAPADFRFAASVASFGMLLRDSPHRGTSSYDDVLRVAGASVGADEGGYRKGFLDLVRKAQTAD
ncbi:MAG: VWA domain-containing protein [Planctomycetota bacterium]|nr:VWA domain-containing protein [Planctomycetota bacterium]